MRTFADQTAEPLGRWCILPFHVDYTTHAEAIANGLGEVALRISLPA